MKLTDLPPAPFAIITVFFTVLLLLFAASPVLWFLLVVLGGVLGDWHCYWFPHALACR